MSSQKAPRWLMRSTQVYRALISLRYGKDLRDRYGEPMVELFGDDLEERVRERGLRGFLSGWGRALRDLLRKQPPAVGPVGGMGRSHMGRGSALRSLLKDLGYARRSLTRDPNFAATGIGIVGAAVALNVMVFAVVNAYLLQPLPYPEPDRVVDLRTPDEVLPEHTEGVLERTVSWDLDAFTILGDPGPQMARGAWVSHDFLDVYGVEPVIGRAFLPEESTPGGPAVALIGHGLWQDRFGGSTEVLGQVLRAYTSDRPDDAESFTIVGVLPAGFWHFNDYTEVLAPLRSPRAVYAGRLAAGVTPEGAAGVLTERVGRDRAAGSELTPVQVIRTHDRHVSGIRPTLVSLLIAVVLVLLVACTNVAVLLLVRTSRRAGEFDLRRLLGAGRARLGRQLVFEGLLVTSLAGVLGLGVAQAGLALLRRLSDPALWRGLPGGADALRIDPVVLTWTLACCAAAGVLFGVVSLWPSGGGRNRRWGGGARSTDTRGRRRARGAMVAVELALSLALLAGAGLMVQSAIHLQRQDLGFQPEGLTKGQLGLRQASYPEPQERLDFFDAVLADLGETPGVEAVGLVSAVPFTWGFGTREVESEGAQREEAVLHVADEGYFRTLGIPLRQGRIFGPDDREGSPQVALVSPALAGRLWPDESPIGQRIRLATRGEEAEPDPWATVVGEVGEVRKGVGGFEGGDVYFAHRQVASPWMNVVVRGTLPQRSLVEQMEAAVLEQDPTVAVSAVRNVSESIRAATAPSRFLATLFATFALLALVLATVGFYGVMAYAAKQAQKSLAIRMALGADARDVRRLFARDLVPVLAAGLLLGGLLSLGLSEALREQLHGVAPEDVRTLLGTALVLGVAAVLAAWLPVRRAERIQPMSILRGE
ncbi:MAG: hypothetical protein HKO53_15355 [Gemmatimonadetes bacterium]|nr:hypothetical protein [Gemmatimonadota bacterium]NNM34454.1 hypothetical protein [Gemmatimonadota bacterium]